MSLHFNDLFFGSALPFKSVRLQVCGPRSRGPPHRAEGAPKASRTRVACATRGDFLVTTSLVSLSFIIQRETRTSHEVRKTKQRKLFRISRIRAHTRTRYFGTILKITHEKYTRREEILMSIFGAKSFLSQVFCTKYNISRRKKTIKREESGCFERALLHHERTERKLVRAFFRL